MTLEFFGIYTTRFNDIANKSPPDQTRISYIIKKLLEDEGGYPYGLTRALIVAYGETKFSNTIAKEAKCPFLEAKRVLRAYLNSVKEKEILLTGAEAVSILLIKNKVSHVFAYPGTSELVFCDALLRTPNITLINGRGDKESAFMAAGGSSLLSSKSVALLHGARGGTNAAGAIADARRNEIGTVFIIGLPSTSSSKYLPPHGESDLISTLGKFVKYAWEITDLPPPAPLINKSHNKAKAFISVIIKAIRESRSFPVGPTIVGIPQDAFERRLIPLEYVQNINISTPVISMNHNELKKVSRIIKNKKHPVILVDDFLYKNIYAKPALQQFAEKLRAPILQVAYRRGPMLFESTAQKYNPYFVGQYDGDNPYHKKLMSETDLLITIEDRNAYERVVGALPKCVKIAITSNPLMTIKNGYLTDSDMLLSGNPVTKMRELLKVIPPKKDSINIFKKYCKSVSGQRQSKSSVFKYTKMRNMISSELAKIFTQLRQPILVDDSQMFGGLLSQYYDLFPKKLRVFGDHGAFIGGGMAYAAGLAYSNTEANVFCTIGDQSFTNAFQALAFISQEQVPVVYIICNNGKSVSLMKQIHYQDKSAFDSGNHRFLNNVPKMSYTDIAKSFGIRSHQIVVDPDRVSFSLAQQHLRSAFQSAAKVQCPVVIELILPSNQTAWEGIWAIKGNETTKS
ncbi:MAG: Acetolactate synthase large subunit [Microgenomates group bacterium GW2011_GWC1_43_11]|nr:MAG: Acetolactate synthase large subunit [Microgenomates group bacterium GW2011_GWC1_43_11]